MLIRTDTKIRIVIFELIFLLMAAPFNRLSNTQVMKTFSAGEGSSVLEKGTVLLKTDQSICILNSIALTCETILLADKGIGDFAVSPDRRHIYFTSGFVHSSSQENPARLNRYDTLTQENTILFQSTELARMSSISQNGKKMILLLSDIEEPMDSYYCLFDADIRTCTPLDVNIDINQILWVNNKILSSLIDSVDVYTLEGDSISAHTSIQLENFSSLSDLAPIPNSQNMLVAGYQLENSKYTPSFALFDLRTQELIPLPLPVKNDINAAFTHVSISSNGTYTKYQRGLNLTIADYQTGEMLVSIDDVYNSVWSPDGQSVIAYISHLAVPREIPYLASIDIISGTIIKKAFLEDDPDEVSVPQLLRIP